MTKELRNNLKVSRLTTEAQHLTQKSSLLNLDEYIFDEKGKLVGDKYIIQAKEFISKKSAQKSLPKKYKKKLSGKIPITVGVKYRPVDYNHGDLKYHEYIVSDLWWDRRTRYFQNHKKKCAKCSSVENITLHHIRYSKQMFGKEDDKDLEALCKTCHNNFHTKYGVHQNMHKMHRKWMRELTT